MRVDGANKVLSHFLRPLFNPCDYTHSITHTRQNSQWSREIMDNTAVSSALTLPNMIRILAHKH